MDKITLWKTGHPVYQCGNTHVERCAAYDVDSLQEAYHNVINQHSKYWNKYPDANPPYIEHILKGWKLYFYPTKEEAEEATYSLFGKNLYATSDLSAISVRELVEELRNRNGVLVTDVSPYEKETIEVDGPAIVLVIVD